MEAGAVNLDLPRRQMATDLAEVRRDIIRRARNPNLRSFAFSASEPSVWKPTEVTNPECGIPFSDVSAWHFIANQVEALCDLTAVTLRKPPGMVAYEMLLPGAHAQPAIYVKICLKGDRILGRSFHNSTR
jgi:hypothetical protein